MIEAPEIARAEPQAAAVIHVDVAREEIQSAAEPAIEELMKTVTDQGIGPRGPLFMHHVGTTPERFDCVVGVPVDGSVSPAGRVKPSELPGGPVVRTIYHGGYEGLFEAWREFGDRAKRELAERIEPEGLEPGTTLWERYLVGPETSADPADWRTELNRPLVPRSDRDDR